VVCAPTAAWSSRIQQANSGSAPCHLSILQSVDEKNMRTDVHVAVFCQLLFFQPPCCFSCPCPHLVAQLQEVSRQLLGLCRRSEACWQYVNYQAGFAEPRVSAVAKCDALGKQYFGGGAGWLKSTSTAEARPGANPILGKAAGWYCLEISVALQRQRPCCTQPGLLHLHAVSA